MCGVNISILAMVESGPISDRAQLSANHFGINSIVPDSLTELNGLFTRILFDDRAFFSTIYLDLSDRSEPVCERFTFGETKIFLDQQKNKTTTTTSTTKSMKIIEENLDRQQEV